MQHARACIRVMTMRARLAAPVEQVVQDVNMLLRGWAGYLRFGNSARAFDQIRNYALLRLARSSESDINVAGPGVSPGSTDHPI
jgi:hypothetical protein